MSTATIVDADAPSDSPGAGTTTAPARRRRSRGGRGRGGRGRTSGTGTRPAGTDGAKTAASDAEPDSGMDAAESISTEEAPAAAASDGDDAQGARGRGRRTRNRTPAQESWWTRPFEEAARRRCGNRRLGTGRCLRGGRHATASQVDGNALTLANVHEGSDRHRDEAEDDPREGQGRRGGRPHLDPAQAATPEPAGPAAPRRHADGRARHRQAHGDHGARRSRSDRGARGTRSRPALRHPPGLPLDGGQCLPRARAERAARDGSRVRRRRPRPECGPVRGRGELVARGSRGRTSSHRARPQERAVRPRAGDEGPDRRQGRTPHGADLPAGPIPGPCAELERDRHQPASARRGTPASEDDLPTAQAGPTA